MLCANAGVFPDARLADMTEEDIDQVLGTNLKGTILSVQACLPALARSGRGRVILTSLDHRADHRLPGLDRTTARARPGSWASCARPRSSWRPSGITVNAVLPGNIADRGPGRAWARTTSPG